MAAIKITKRALWRIGFIVATPFFLLGGCLLMDMIPMSAARPPANLTTLEEFRVWKRGAIMGIRTFENEGVTYTVMLAPAGRNLASGPSAYLFDPEGKFVDWTADMGDLYTVKHRFDLSSGRAKPRIDAALLATAIEAMPKEVSTNELVRALETGLWNSNRTAVAVSVSQPEASVVFAFLRKEDGSYIAVDASRVENGNFGKLGKPRSGYERYETTPVEWKTREDGRFMVGIRTRAWIGGQRYTVSEPLVINTDGSVLWR